MNFQPVMATPPPNIVNDAYTIAFEDETNTVYPCRNDSNSLHSPYPPSFLPFSQVSACSTPGFCRIVFVLCL